MKNLFALILSFVFLQNSFSQEIQWSPLHKIKLSGWYDYLGQSNKGEHYIIKASLNIKRDTYRGGMVSNSNGFASFEVKPNLAIVNLGKSFEQALMTDFETTTKLSCILDVFIQNDHIYMIYCGKEKKTNPQVYIETFSLTGVSEKKEAITSLGEDTDFLISISPNKNHFTLLYGRSNLKAIRYTFNEGKAEKKEDFAGLSNTASNFITTNKGDFFYVTSLAGNTQLCKGASTKISLSKDAIFQASLRYFENEQKLGIATHSGKEKNGFAYVEKVNAYLFDNNSGKLDFSSEVSIDKNSFTKKDFPGIKDLSIKNLFLYNNELVVISQRESVVTETRNSGNATYEYFEAYSEEALITKFSAKESKQLFVPYLLHSDAALPRAGLSAGYIEGNKLILLYNIKSKKLSAPDLQIASLDLVSFTLKTEKVSVMQEHDVLFNPKNFFDKGDKILFIANQNAKIKIGQINIK